MCCDSDTMAYSLQRISQCNEGLNITCSVSAKRESIDILHTTTANNLDNYIEPWNVRSNVIGWGVWSWPIWYLYW